MRRQTRNIPLLFQNVQKVMLYTFGIDSSHPRWQKIFTCWRTATVVRWHDTCCLTWSVQSRSLPSRGSNEALLPLPPLPLLPPPFPLPPPPPLPPLPPPLPLLTNYIVLLLLLLSKVHIEWILIVIILLLFIFVKVI